MKPLARLKPTANVDGASGRRTTVGLEIVIKISTNRIYTDCWDHICVIEREIAVFMTLSCELEALSKKLRRNCRWGGILMVGEILSEKLANFASTLS